VGTGATLTEADVLTVGGRTLPTFAAAARLRKAEAMRMTRFTVRTCSFNSKLGRYVYRSRFVHRYDRTGSA
jgi:hypothetical protein